MKYMCKYLLEKRYDDMEFMAKNFDGGCIDRLKLVASTPFGRLTYTKAIELLEEAVAQGKKFENQVEWGIDLASEHERFFLFFCYLLISLNLKTLDKKWVYERCLLSCNYSDT